MKLSKCLLGALLINTCFAQPATFIGPIAKGTFTSTINDVTAYSLLGEAGLKNFRIGSTVAWKLMDNQFLKISGEYLWQDITYNYYTKNTRQWVRQGAVAALYQYDICEVDYSPSLTIAAFLTYAPSRALGDLFIVRNINGIPTSFVNLRRVAGSATTGASAGFAFHPWCGSQIGFDLNYDNAHYHKTYIPENDSMGLGGTLRLKQQLTDQAQLHVSYVNRQPFNRYAADVEWLWLGFGGLVTASLDGSYTVGKNSLPSTYLVGLTLNYFLDERCPVLTRLQGCKKDDFITVPFTDELLTWTKEPAVYIPQVLALSDEKLITV